MSKIKILVAYHKKDQLYKNEVLLPIHCGRSLLQQDDPDRAWYLENLIGDDTGENISGLNKDFCELTALYWAWKNYDRIENPDYLGLAHYRRLWYLADDFPAAKGSVLDQIALTAENIHTLIEKYPVILPHIYKKDTLSYESFQKRSRLSETRFPILYRGYRKFEEDHRFYNGNMFIFPKEVFFEYCEVLFGSLLDTKAHVEATQDKVYPRYYGTEAEYLTSFFQMDLVNRNQYASKEMPVVFLDLPKAIKV
jgi:hypothetical protein